MSVQHIEDMLGGVKYPNMRFIVGWAGDRLHIRGEFTQPCIKTGEPTLWYTRRWYISKDATKSEVVQTCLKIVLTAVEHEAREKFRYRGRAVYGPHIDVDALWEVCPREDGRA